jgi:hypothetical protein
VPIATKRTAAKYYSIGDNSPHFHGTHVPVEEPSTASEADISSIALLNGFASGGSFRKAND